MSTTILAQTTASIQNPFSQVYEYALIVVNPIDNDTQALICEAVSFRTAAFTFIPAPEDWQYWLSGWNSCGYSLIADPQLIRTV